jgi:hypothetical protein
MFSFDRENFKLKLFCIFMKYFLLTNHQKHLQMETLLPLSAAAVSTAGLMYPVDVMRALKMASAGSNEAFSIGDFYKKYGIKGMLGQGLLPELLKSSSMRVSKFFFFPIVLDSKKKKLNFQKLLKKKLHKQIQLKRV